MIGLNLQIDSPWLVEIIARAGFDFAMLDAEYGIVYRDLPMLIIAADAAGITPIVRVPSHDRSFILLALESGAGGIQVPMVNTPDQAMALVREVKYASLGIRSFSNATRADDFGAILTQKCVELMNPESLLIVQLEMREQYLLALLLFMQRKCGYGVVKVCRPFSLPACIQSIGLLRCYTKN